MASTSDMQEDASQNEMREKLLGDPLIRWSTRARTENYQVTQLVNYLMVGECNEPSKSFLEYWKTCFEELLDIEKKTITIEEARDMTLSKIQANWDELLKTVKGKVIRRLNTANGTKFPEDCTWELGELTAEFWDLGQLKKDFGLNDYQVCTLNHIQELLCSFQEEINHLDRFINEMKFPIGAPAKEPDPAMNVVMVYDDETDSLDDPTTEPDWVLKPRVLAVKMRSMIRRIRKDNVEQLDWIVTWIQDPIGYFPPY